MRVAGAGGLGAPRGTEADLPQAHPPLQAHARLVLHNPGPDAVAIRNARLYEEARAYADRLRALEEVNRLVSSSLNTQEVLDNLARAIAPDASLRVVGVRPSRAA